LKEKKSKVLLQPGTCRAIPGCGLTEPSTMGFAIATGLGTGNAVGMKVPDTVNVS
jgi:hypothetical protein